MRRIAASSAGLIRVLPRFVVNGQIIATRRGSVLRYTHADHLGSASLQTDTNGNPVASTNVGHWSYGTVRSGSPTALNTDRTYTGQKQDSTGLLYYNARYYDPSLGQFLSPDTLVPDAGLVLDYNRYMYVRGNPLKYTDPSGHCGVLADGSPDSADQECWDLADAIYAMWGVDDSIWGRIFRGVDRDYFMQHIATLQAADRNWMLDQHQTWSNLHRQDRELQLTVIPDEVHNPELRSPTSEFVKTIVIDVIECSESFAGCGKALTDVSTGLSGVAALCGIAGLAPCAGVASTASTVSSFAGTVLTGYNIPNGDASSVDLAVSITTTMAGERYGDAGEYTVGFGIGILQWIYDHWD